MNEELLISCPYCGEPNSVIPEPSDAKVEYVEDCQVCCQPIVWTIRWSEDGSEVSARPENE